MAYHDDILAALKLSLAQKQLTRTTKAVADALDAWEDAASALRNIRLIGYASTAEEIAECEDAERRARRAYEAADEARDQVWAGIDADTLVAIARATESN